MFTFPFRFMVTRSTWLLFAWWSGYREDNFDGYLLWQYTHLGKEACSLLFIYAAAVFLSESLESLLSKRWIDIQFDSSGIHCLWIGRGGLATLLWWNAVGRLWFNSLAGGCFPQIIGKWNSHCDNIKQVNEMWWVNREMIAITTNKSCSFFRKAVKCWKSVVNVNCWNSSVINYYKT